MTAVTPISSVGRLGEEGVPQAGGALAVFASAALGEGGLRVPWRACSLTPVLGTGGSVDGRSGAAGEALSARTLVFDFDNNPVRNLL